MNDYYIFAIWMGMALIASLVSVRVATPVALVEIVVGALAGNIPGISAHVHSTAFIVFLAGAGSIVLTFLAGAEIDPVSLRRHWKAALSIGTVSFIAPFAGVWAFCELVLGWSRHASAAGGIALSTTSVAVVYAVMVETGLNTTDIGKLILAGCFVTDLGTVLALGGLFATYGWVLVTFVLVTTAVLLVLPRLTRLAIRHVGHRVSEPEIKLLLLVLFGLGGLAFQATGESVLPAYLAGLVVAGMFTHDRILTDRMRSLAFALLTPFFFLRAGTLIQAHALVTGAGVIAALLGVKLVTKLLGIWPVAGRFGLPVRDRAYTTLLMATGLTFGSISSLVALNHGYITRGQYTELVTVVILSAFVPTLIAQQLFQPTALDQDEEEALGAEDISVIHHPHHAAHTTSPDGAAVARASGGRSTLPGAPAAAYRDTADRSREAL